MKENIFESFNKKICKNCKNKDCPELRVRLDGSLKCDEYERKKEKPIGALIRVMRIGD